MSRIGKKPIKVPKNVEVTVDNGCVNVKGPKGVLSVCLDKFIDAKVVESDGENVVLVSVKDEERPHINTQWGTTRALISNMMVGVNIGFTKSLEAVGVGYKINVKGNDVIVNAGHSHDVIYKLPAGITATAENNILTISGADKQLVGQVSSHIRKIRKPEPYKGKGIKYTTEVIRRKAGKAAKTTA
jgi:large subunit ribosomal protein L6